MGSIPLREADIRPDELMAEQARRYEADVARLVARREEFVAVRCPACDADDPRPEWRKYGLEYPRCAACGTVYMSPRPTPEILDDYYRSSTNYEYWNEVVFPASEDARRERIFRPRAEQVADIARRHDTSTGVLVDVGAGFGTFCEEVGALGIFDRVVALEPEPHLAETCRRKGIDVVESPVEQAGDALGRVDVVTSFEVLEHLFSPRAFVERCAELLNPGGLVVITCPNGNGFDIEILREQSATVDAEHINYLNPGSLGALLEACGFEVLEATTPGRLDAELVRKRVVSGDVSLDSPFLRRVLLDDWERLGGPFQDFLATHGLSSNMWLVGRVPGA